MTASVRSLTDVSAVADRLLSRLDGVGRCGSGWRARCPSHGSDKNRALSIAMADDGRLLIHCFVGCTAHEVMQAVGLELSDLFPEQITHNATPEQRRELRERMTLASLRAAAEILTAESLVIACAGTDIVRVLDLLPADHPLQRQDNRQRLDEAVDRVESVRRDLAALRRSR